MGAILGCSPIRVFIRESWLLLVACSGEGGVVLLSFFVCRNAWWFDKGLISSPLLLVRGCHGWSWSLVSVEVSCVVVRLIFVWFHTCSWSKLCRSLVVVVRFLLRILGFLHTWSGHHIVVLICMGFLKSIRVDRLFVAVFQPCWCAWTFCHLLVLVGQVHHCRWHGS